MKKRNIIKIFKNKILISGLTPNIHQYYCDGTKLDFESTSKNVKLYKEYVLNRKGIGVLYGKRCSTFYPQF